MTRNIIKSNIETDEYSMEITVDQDKIPSYEIERRKEFVHLTDLKTLYEMMDMYGDVDTTFSFTTHDFGDDTKTLKGDELDRIIICNELYCYAFIYKSGYIDLVTRFEVKVN